MALVELLAGGTAYLDTSGLKLPDAIHAATAARSACTHLVTNDLRFKALKGPEVVVLSELIRRE